MIGIFPFFYFLLDIFIEWYFFFFWQIRIHEVILIFFHFKSWVFFWGGDFIFQQYLDHTLGVPFISGSLFLLKIHKLSLLGRVVSTRKAFCVR